MLLHVGSQWEDEQEHSPCVSKVTWMLSSPLPSMLQGHFFPIREKQLSQSFFIPQTRGKGINTGGWKAGEGCMSRQGRLSQITYSPSGNKCHPGWLPTRCLCIAAPADPAKSGRPSILYSEHSYSEPSFRGVSSLRLT